MIRLRTLGSVDLRAADGSQMQSVLRQPKRLALLLYLALEGPVFHRRDRLLALFWPESDEEKARGALNQQVFQLRAALGKDAIVNRGDDEIGLSADAVWTDAREFGDHVRAGRFEDAMALYHGELLPNFVLDDASEFERWLESQRGRISEQACVACGHLAETAQRAGQTGQAVDWARRALSIQPLNESAHQRLIALLDHSGDRAGALQAFENLRELLRAEFDAEPSAETTALIRAVRSRAESKSQAYQVEGPPARSLLWLAPRNLRERQRLTLAVGSGVVIIAALIWSALIVRAPEPYRPPADHVAVLFFNDESENRDLGYLAEGLTSTLIDQLGQVRKLNVVSQNGVRPFRGHDVPLDSVARQLDVGTIVGGSVTRSNDRVRVTVELTDGASGMIMQSKKFERPIGELFALLDDVSGEVAAFLRVSLGEELRLREQQAETRSVEAWQLYRRAQYEKSLADSLEISGAYSEADMELQHADSMLAGAEQLDDDWAAPIVLRADLARGRATLAMLSGNRQQQVALMKKARAFADRAIKVDARSAAAHEVRGDVRLLSVLFGVPANMATADSLLRGAEADLKAALALSPDLPRAESRLSALYYVKGQFEDARRAARRALEADAYLTDADDITNRLFFTSFEVGDDVDAGHWCDEVRRRMPNRWPSAYCDLVLLGWSSAGSPDPRKAILLLERSAGDDPPALRAAMRPHLMALTAAVLARAGQADSARAMLRQALASAPHDLEVLPLAAVVHVLLKENREAASVLAAYLKANPLALPRVMAGRMYRPLRDDPEFRAATRPIALRSR